MRAPNGKLIIGTLEKLYGVAQIDEESTLDDLCYDGHTDINWDGQETFVNEHGDRVFIDEDGNEWTESQLATAPIQEETK